MQKCVWAHKNHQLLILWPIIVIDLDEECDKFEQEVSLILLYKKKVVVRQIKKK